MTGAGVYVHIPVCEQRCRYCSFYSVSGWSMDWESYHHALLRQLNDVEAGDRLEVDSVYFGGGTPSLAPASFFGRMLEGIRNRLHVRECPEVTVEVNPEHGNYPWFKDLAAAGVNRLSIGLQSMDDHTLSRLGRIHTVARSTACVTEALSVFENVSVDLIIGIRDAPPPEEQLQRMNDWLGGIQHVSVYLLEGDRVPDLIGDPDEAADHYLGLAALLHDHGFRQYEISNYARPGFESRHNNHYWLGDPYIGLGPSAHSFLYPVRISVDADLDDFLRGDFRFHRINYEEDELQRELFILGLRRTEGVSGQWFLKRFGVNVTQRFGWLPDRFPGLIVVEGDRIRLTAEGMLLSNEIFQEILP